MNNEEIYDKWRYEVNNKNINNELNRINNSY